MTVGAYLGSIRPDGVRRSRRRWSFLAVALSVMGTAVAVPITGDAQAAAFGGMPSLEWATAVGGAGVSRQSHTNVDANDAGVIAVAAGSRVAAYAPDGTRLWTNSVGPDAVDVAIDGAGNVFVVGGFSASATFGTGAQQVTLTTPERESGGYEYRGFIAKFDAAGALDWAILEGIDNYFGKAVAANPAGGFVTTGGYYGNVVPLKLGVGAREVTLTGEGAFVAWYDGAGRLEDATSVEWYRAPLMVAVDVAASGDVAIGGTASGIAYFASVSPTGSVRFQKAMRVDNAGMWSSWAGYYGTLTDVAVDPTGNVAVSGDFFGPTTFGEGGTAVQLTTAHSDAFLASYTSNGVLRWVRQAGTGVVDVASSVDVDVAGGLVVAGRFWATSTAVFDDGVGGTATLPSVNTSGYDAFMAGYSSDGTLEWADRGTSTLPTNVVIRYDRSGPQIATGRGGIAVSDFAVNPLTWGGANVSVTGYLDQDAYLARLSSSGVGFESLVPARLLDTRPGGKTLDGRFAGDRIRAGGSTLALDVTARGGVSDDAAAVALNVTAMQANSIGYVTVFPCGEARPLASNVNFAPGAPIANAVIAKVGSGGKVCLYVSETVHLAVDVNGYMPAGTSYVALVPVRLLDTRSTGETIDGAFERGGVRPAGSTSQLQVTGRGGVPADASAVVLNVTAIQAHAIGYVTVFPCGETRPLASNVNFAPGAPVPNAVIAKVGTGGKVCLYVSETVHLAVDVNGYHPPGGDYVALVPVRLLDTRSTGETIDGAFERGGVRPAGSTLQLQVTGRGGVPADASAVVLNVTAIQAHAIGYVTVFPCGETRPLASNVNCRPGVPVPNAVIAKVGNGGKVCLYVSETVHLAVDVNGYHS